MVKYLNTDLVISWIKFKPEHPESKKYTELSLLHVWMWTLVVRLLVSLVVNTLGEMGFPKDLVTSKEDLLPPLQGCCCA